MKKANLANTIQNASVADMNYIDVLSLARTLSGKTYSEIAEEVGKGRETIRRYFTDPTYNPPSHLIPDLCRVLGNTLLIEWQAAQIDGHLTFIDTETPTEGRIEVHIAELTSEFSDVLREDGNARMDGEYDINEISKIIKELGELVKKGEEVRLYLKKKRGNIKVGEEV